MTLQKKVFAPFIVTPLGFAAHSVIAPYLCVLRTSTANNAAAAQTQRRINARWNHP